MKYLLSIYKLVKETVKSYQYFYRLLEKSKERYGWKDVLRFKEFSLIRWYSISDNVEVLQAV